MTEIAGSIIEICFPVVGNSAPSQNAYPLYSAISRVIPEAHGATWLGVHTLKGRSTKPGIIQLSRSAVLRIRLPVEHVPTMLRLAGTILDVGGHSIRCGIPQIFALRAASTLRSRLVVIKPKDFSGHADPQSFLDALRRSLIRLGVTAEPELERKPFPDSRESFARRILSIRNTKIPGYGVIIRNLEPSDSLIIQENGLGGRRRMGCGLFVPLGRGD